ncbi:hypothetical protein DFH09DRAFT_1323677 [Mycena vulgaris]|nr:hypothetical protein DFH09DRAFT_1323677 [Mycena vulgaris]
MADPDPAAPQARRAPRTQRDFENRYEEARGISFRAGLPHYRDAEAVAGYNTSGSRLGVDALLAFRVFPMLDLPPKDVIPGYSDQEPARPGLRETMLNYLVAATASDLGLVTVADLPSDDPRLLYREELIMLEKERGLASGLEITRATTIDATSMTNFLGNPFLLVFTAIRDLRSRLLAEQHGDLYDGLTAEQSGEANEDKAERGSEELLHRLMEVILLYFAQQTGEDWFRSTAAASSHQIDLLWDHTESLPVPTRKNKTANPIPEEKPAPGTEPLPVPKRKNRTSNAIPEEKPAPAPDTIAKEKPADKKTSPTILRCEAKDDGYLYLSRAGKTSGSNRWSNIPIAKRLKSTGSKSVKEQLADFAEKEGTDMDGDFNETPEPDEDKKAEKFEEEIPKDAVIIKTGDLKITAQQFAEMLTGIYANAKYFNDAKRAEHARQLEKQQFATDSNRLERIKQALAAKKSGQKEKVLSKKDDMRMAIENSQLAKEDNVAQKTLAAQKPLGNRNGVGSKLSIARKVFMSHSGPEKKVTKLPPSVVTNIQKQRLIPKAGGTKQERLEVRQKIEAKTRAGKQKLEDKKSKAKLVKLAETMEMKTMQYPDQEAFNIRIRHTYLSISRVVTPEDYLKAVRTKPRLDRGDGTIKFKQTKEFNLLRRDGRRQAGKAIWALLAYLHSGETQIGRLQGASKESQALYTTNRTVERTAVIRLPTQRYPPRGIQNFNASCYANSAIQGISAAVSLRNLQPLLNPHLVNVSIPAAFLRTVAALIDSPLDAKPVDLDPLLHAVCAVHPYDKTWFNGMTQQDPAEFIRFLLDQLRQASSGMNDLFTFDERSKVKCTKCDQVSEGVTYPTELFFRLQVQETMCEMDDMLKQYLEPVRFDKWTDCPTECNAPAVRTLSFDRLPRVAVVQLERTRDFLVKNPPTDSQPDDGVEPQVLENILEARKRYKDQLRRWMAVFIRLRNAGASTDQCTKDFESFRNRQPGIKTKIETPLNIFSEDKKSFRTFTLSSSAEKEVQYELYAVICHAGAVDAGHYVAYVLHDDETGKNKPEWYLCNDNHVRIGPMDPSTVVAELQAEKIPYEISTESDEKEPKYFWKHGKWGSTRMLFYRRLEDSSLSRK